jgi:hypothetical protein
MCPELIWVVFFLPKYFLSECFSFQKEKIQNKTRQKNNKTKSGDHFAVFRRHRKKVYIVHNERNVIEEFIADSSQ